MFAGLLTYKYKLGQQIEIRNRHSFKIQAILDAPEGRVPAAQPTPTSGPSPGAHAFEGLHESRQISQASPDVWTQSDRETEPPLRLSGGKGRHLCQAGRLQQRIGIRRQQGAQARTSGAGCTGPAM